MMMRRMGRLVANVEPVLTPIVISLTDSYFDQSFWLSLDGDRSCRACQDPAAVDNVSQLRPLHCRRAALRAPFTVCQNLAITIYALPGLSLGLKRPTDESLFSRLVLVSQTGNDNYGRQPVYIKNLGRYRPEFGPEAKVRLYRNPYKAD